MSKVLLATILVATVRQFNGSNDDPATADKNGKMPILLDVLAGQCPNARVLSGTVAERGGLEVGKTYMITCQEQDEVYHDDETGEDIPRYNFSAHGDPLTFGERLSAVKELGVANIIKVVEKNSEQGDKRGSTKGSTRKPKEEEFKA